MKSLDASKRGQKGFTLIELLVVIAIIAILAAILFPVFAQAKVQAKVAVAISNVKQTGLALLMYENDYDDSLPLSWDWNAAVYGYNSWQGMTYPYTKNWGVMLNPLIQAPSGQTAYWQRFEHMGAFPTEASVPAVNNKDGNILVSSSFYNQTPTELNGLMGFGNPFSGYPYETLGSPSLNSSQIGAPADASMVTPASAWDYWIGIFGNLQPFDWCGGWSPPSYDVVPGDWGFFGPVAVVGNPSYRTGINAGCYHAAGRALMVACDGHAKTMDYVGQLMQKTTLPSGQPVFTHFYPAGTQ